VHDVLADRKRWIEQINENFESRLTGENGGYMAGDTGHEFRTFSGVNSGPTAFSRRRSNESEWIRKGPAFCSNIILKPGWVDKISTNDRSGAIGGHEMPAYGDVQYATNSAFSGMNPASPAASLGVTVLELLRGDFPSVVRNYNKVLTGTQDAVKAARAAGNAAGSEYLNVTFGWTPVVRELANVISVLANADALIYSGASRRKRYFQGPSVNIEGPTSGVNAGSVFSSEPDGWRTSWEVPIPGTYRDASSIDYRISARIVSNARPTRGANQFIDKANDVINRLGFWSPSMGWDLMSYSWLVDWSINLGSSLENAAFYGKAPGQKSIDYAYLTTFCRFSRTITSRASQGTSGSGLNTEQHNLIGGLVTNTSTIVKDRRRISPFGLGINMAGLTPSQWTTLTALGLSRGL
jgi:hypothetical protein